MCSAARRRAAALAALALCAALGHTVADDGETPMAALAFEEQLDGKCQILSEGGKLVVLRNTHPARAVHYRLVRLFLGVPQSRVDGWIAAGGTPQKLGCNRVNGRKQSWRIERAVFDAAADEKSP